MLNTTIFRWQIYREWPAFYFIWFSLLFVSILLLRSVYLVQIISNKCETEFLGVLSGRLSILGAWDQHKGFSFIFYSTTKVRYILNILWEKWDKLKVNDWDLGTRTSWLLLDIIKFTTLRVSHYPGILHSHWVRWPSLHNNLPRTCPQVVQHIYCHCLYLTSNWSEVIRFIIGSSHISICRTWEEWKIEEWSEIHPNQELNVVSYLCISKPQSD